MRTSLTRTLVAIVLIGLILSGDFAMAQQSLVLDETTLTMDLAEVIDVVIGILSWGWVLLANLAGKLMTNEFVYGEFINLDSILFQMWNVAKNFANFGLGFFFIYQVFKYFFSQGNSTNKIGSTIIRIIIAAVGIQISWFLVAATVDLATVVTTAVSAFPNAVLEDNFQNQEQLINSIKEVPTKVTLKTRGEINEKSVQMSSEKLKDTELTSAEYLDFIVPAPNDISGPLMYMGFSALRVQDYMTLTLDAPSGEKPIGLLVTTFLKFGILLAFTLALILLVVVNILRIMYLWLFIAFSPILILLLAMEVKDPFAGSSLSNFSIFHVLRLIFTPVIYVGYLGIMLIAVVTMQRVLLNSTAMDTNNCNQNIDGITMCYDPVSKSSSVNIDDISSGVTIEGEIFPPSFQDAAANIFTSIMISIFTLLMMRGLVRIMSQSSGAIAKSTTENITGVAQNVVGSVPIVPLAGGQSINSLKALPEASSNRLRTAVRKKNAASVAGFNTKLDRFLGLQSGVGADNLIDLRELATKKNDFSGTSSKFLNKANEIISNVEEYSLRTSSGNLMGTVDGWFVYNKDNIRNLPDLKTRPSIQDAFDKAKDARSIEAFATAIESDVDRQFFLDWLHKKLGGTGGSFTKYDDFLRKPLKEKSRA